MHCFNAIQELACFHKVDFPKVVLDSSPSLGFPMGVWRWFPCAKGGPTRPTIWCWVKMFAPCLGLCNEHACTMDTTIDNMLSNSFMFLAKRLASEKIGFWGIILDFWREAFPW